MQWSEQQNAIFKWFEGGDPERAKALVMKARAGTGKTTTILEGINRAPEKNIMLSAFNKNIAQELQAKLKNPYAEAKTLHAFGYSIIRRYWPKSNVDTKRTERLAEQAAGNRAPDEMMRMIAKLATKAKEMAPMADKPEDLYDLAEEFDCIPDSEWEEDGWDLAEIARNALEVMKLSCKPDGTVDYSDMLFLPLAQRWARGKYDLVVIDEAQDLAAAQIMLARKSVREGGRLAVVGDDRQCHPAGTIISMTGGGRIRIEALHKREEVVSYHDCFRGIRSQGREVLGVGVRQYSGRMIRIHAGDKILEVTPNHKIPTRCIDLKKQSWALYAMEQNETSRIGCCQMLYKSAFGPAMRARQEDADRLWVLHVFESRDEARIYETLKPGIKDKLLRAIGDNRNSLLKCLEHFGREYEWPLYVKKRGEHLGRYIYVTQACNLIDGINLVRTFDGTRDGGGWEPVKISHRTVEDVPVYSLSVEPTEGGQNYYVANGILVHNSIYGFRGADSGVLDRIAAETKADQLKLTTTYRCPKAVVALAQRIVPDYEAAPSAPDGFVGECARDAAIASILPGNYLLSRTNAPLIGFCLQILRAGKRARMQGRDIGAGLIALANKWKSRTMTDFLSRLGKWEEREIARAEASNSRGKDARVDKVRDQADTLRALSEGLSGIRELQTRIESLFADDGTPAVVCSSIHRIKGLESDRVFVLKSTLRADADPPCECGHFAHDKRECKRCGCGSYAPDKAKQQEERNLMYVAVTRSKNELHWVTGDF